MSELWVPGGPSHVDFVRAVHRRIELFAEKHGQAVVELELRDGSLFALDSIAPEPGFGFVTISPHPGDDGEPTQELIVPLVSIGRIVLSPAAEKRGRLGFRLPAG